MTADEPENLSPAGGPDAGYEAFVRLLVEHEPRLRAYLRGLLPTWADVEEVMQNASLVAWRKFSEFQQDTNFGGWLLTIARFEALKHRRNMARSPLVFSDDVWDLLASESSAEADPAHRRREALEKCLGKLPGAQRELVLQAHTPGARLKEIARQSGSSEQAFYKTIQRLRAALLECISRTLAQEGQA
ncbi:MAG: sigma-70 family RNA polymerase sigma factor [Chthoniobacter sp.]|uniref:sigma-70 family RNA polymerase sigma factor n=1 Tax=Chthoniobacter sp. TaxID=2510640 RepID=UPI0032ABDBD9